MEAIVLAGGLGTRLRQVVNDLPKPMAPVAGKPFLEILLTFLAQHGVTRVILSIGFMAEVITEHFKEEFAGMDIVYEIEQTQLGTGGAILSALQHCQDDHVLIANGDTFVDFDLAKLEQQWHKNQQPVIVAKQITDTSRYGRLEIVDEKVVGFAEKGISGTGLINAGVFIIPTVLLDNFSIGEQFSFETDFLVQYIQNNDLDIFITDRKFIDIGIPEDYQTAQKLLKI